MEIYLVKTNDYFSYDDYDAVVLIANDENDAIELSQELCSNFTTNVTVLSIGIPHKNQKRGEILSSYNAG